MDRLIGQFVAILIIDGLDGLEDSVLLLDPTLCHGVKRF